MHNLTPSKLQSADIFHTCSAQHDGSLISFSGAIFDMDGTILDSSYLWDHVAENALIQMGYTPKPTLLADVFPYGDEEMAQFLHKDYNTTESPAYILSLLDKQVSRYYSQEAELKAGALSFLRILKANGVRLALASASSPRYVLPAMRHVGAEALFDVILTVDEVGRSKSEPDIFLQCAQRMGTRPEDTWLFEDSYVALRTAKRAGFRVCGIADHGARMFRSEVQSSCDVFLESLEEWRALPFAKELSE